MSLVSSIIHIILSVILSFVHPTPFTDHLFIPLNNVVPSNTLKRSLLQKPAEICIEETVICPPCIEIDPYVYQTVLNGACTSILDTGFHACLNTLLDDSIIQVIFEEDCYTACKEDFNETGTNFCNEIQMNSVECQGGIASAFYSCGDVQFSTQGYQELAEAVKSNECELYQGFGLYNCGGTLATEHLYDVVSQNKCTLQCVSDENFCRQSCQGGEYVCDVEDARLSTTTFIQLKNSQECSEDLDPTFCISQGSIIVKKDVFDAVQQNRCNLECPTEIGQDTCPVQLTLTGQSLGFQGYDLIYGQYRNCSQECDYGQGGGIRERGVFCVEKSTGLPSSLDKCTVVVSPHSVNITTPCGEEQCPSYYWDYGPWSECPKTCNTNDKNITQKFSQRTSICKSMETKKAVGQNSTEFQNWCAKNSPQNTRPCNKQVCEQRSYEIGEWSECAQGLKYREVKCKDQNNQFVNVLECIKSMKYVPPSSTTCNTFVCKSRSDCSNNGNCKNGRCICSFGYFGVKCEVSKKQCKTGVMDKQSQCCNSGIVSSLTGKCCSLADQKHMSLDKFGDCCSGYLNSLTGECGIDHQFIDMFSGEGCKTGLTASGRCAPDGADIDLFGVPNGYARSGKFVIEVRINNKNESSLTNPQLKSVAAKAFGIKLAQVKISKQESQQENLQISAQSARGRLLLQDLSEDRVLKISPPYEHDMTYANVIEKLHNGNNQLDILSVRAEGVSGNGICEVGEQGQSKDCPSEFKLAPIGRGDMFCSGQGTPFHSSGRCLCWAGYDGDACQQCGEGFYRINHHCQATLTLLQTAEQSTLTPENLQIQGLLRQANVQELEGSRTTDQQTTEDNNKETAGSDVGIIVGAVMGCVAVVVGIVAMYAIIQRHRRQATASSIVNSTADESTTSGASWTFTNPEQSEGGGSTQAMQEQQHRATLSFTNASSVQTSGAGGECSTAASQLGDGRYKVVLLNNNPLPQMLSWLSSLGINSDQVEVRSSIAPSSNQDNVSNDAKSSKCGTTQFALPPATARSMSSEQRSSDGSSTQSWDRGFKVAQMIAKSAGSDKPLISGKTNDTDEIGNTKCPPQVEQENQVHVN